MQKIIFRGKKLIWIKSRKIQGKTYPSAKIRLRKGKREKQSSWLEYYSKIRGSFFLRGRRVNALKLQTRSPHKKPCHARSFFEWLSLAAQRLRHWAPSIGSQPKLSIQRDSTGGSASPQGQPLGYVKIRYVGGQSGRYYRLCNTFGTWENAYRGVAQ